MTTHHFTSVRFHRFKGFREYSVSLHSFNILVGPNNCGKSTIIGAFRILAEGMRKARAKNPILLMGPDGNMYGYSIDLSDIPVATENIFYNYEDSEPATITFRLSNSNELLLFFPEVGVCYLFCFPKGKQVRNPTGFIRAYDASIGFVPVLGPVEHNEQLYQKEAARLALLTHHAARNFRNIWHHYPEDFDEFRALVKSTWPGMDIKQPQLDYSHSPTRLHMFCPEERIPREIFWAGFGFQVWCQMLTYIIRGSGSSLFLIDEPDIYLHSDLQRQLIAILRSLGPDVLIATHSTEMITEAEPDEIVVISKQSPSAKRIRQPGELQHVFEILGSNLNPVLTQLAKTKRALFVEGKDFQLLSLFARRLGKTRLANRGDFAVIPVEGFNPPKVRDFVKGIETTLGSAISAGVIFDRDYRSDEECLDIRNKLEEFCVFARIHGCKEIENFLLQADALHAAVQARLAEVNKRTGGEKSFAEDMNAVLETITSAMKNEVLARYLEVRRPYEKGKDPSLHDVTISERIMANYDESWGDLQERLKLVPGKQTLSALNAYLAATYGVTMTPRLIVDSFDKSTIAPEMIELIDIVEDFSRCKR